MLLSLLPFMAKCHEQGLHLFSSISPPPAKASPTTIQSLTPVCYCYTAPVKGTSDFLIAKVNQLSLAIFLNLSVLGSYRCFLFVFFFNFLPKSSWHHSPWEWLISRLLWESLLLSTVCFRFLEFSQSLYISYSANSHWRNVSSPTALTSTLIPLDHKCLSPEHTSLFHSRVHF